MAQTFIDLNGLAHAFSKVKALVAGKANADLSNVDKETLAAAVDPATSSAAGLMSAADKAKLDGIATGANKITVDSALSSSSTNPVQNKAVNEALAGKASISRRAAGANWQSLGLREGVSWESVCYGAGRFVAVSADDGIAAYSEDGINWTEFTMPSTASWYNICYGNGKFVAVAYNSNNAAYSEDGINWTLKTIPQTTMWYDLCFGNGKFVAIGYNSKYIAYSEDGVTWIMASQAQSDGWRSVCYGNGKFVAVTSGGTEAAYSEDGINWTMTSLPLSVAWYSVCYGGGKFVAVAFNSGSAAISDDGITWAEITMPGENYCAICYGGGKFMATGYNNNLAAYSEDGTDWTAGVLPASAVWNEVCYGGGKFVAVGDSVSGAMSMDYAIAEDTGDPLLIPAAQITGLEDVLPNTGDQDAAGGADVYTATLGTSWTEDSETGVKTQTVSIAGITADHTAKCSNYFAGEKTSDGYAAHVEQENQFLELITNGFAETVAGGIVFTIYGEPNTVSIPVLVEVV